MGRQLITYALGVEPYIRRKQAFTVGGGDAFVAYERSEDDQPVRSPLNRMLDQIVNTVIKALRWFNSPQQKDHRAEYAAKLGAALEAIGEDKNKMVTLVSLATAPAKQRRGYGTLLVRKVTEIADAQGRSTVLTSSNVVNTGFYESCGFHVAQEFELGKGNPTWNEAPVVIRIMVRPPTRSQSGLKLCSDRSHV